MTENLHGVILVQPLIFWYMSNVDQFYVTHSYRVKHFWIWKELNTCNLINIFVLWAWNIFVLSGYILFCTAIFPEHRGKEKVISSWVGGTSDTHLHGSRTWWQLSLCKEAQEAPPGGRRAWCLKLVSHNLTVQHSLCLRSWGLRLQVETAPAQNSSSSMELYGDSSLAQSIILMTWGHGNMKYTLFKSHLHKINYCPNTKYNK